MTQAAVPERRETPRDRPGRAGLRLCSKWLGVHGPYAAQCQSSTRGIVRQHRAAGRDAMATHWPPWSDGVVSFCRRVAGDEEGVPWLGHCQPPGAAGFRRRIEPAPAFEGVIAWTVAIVPTIAQPMAGRGERLLGSSAPGKGAARRTHILAARR